MKGFGKRQRTRSTSSDGTSGRDAAGQRRWRRLVGSDPMKRSKARVPDGSIPPAEQIQLLLELSKLTENNRFHLVDGSVVENKTLTLKRVVWG